MNRFQNSNNAIEELRKGEIAILDDEEDMKIYDKLILKHKSKDELIEMMQKEEFSEFNIGVLIGMALTMEAKIKPKQGFRRFIPNSWRK